MQEIHKQKYKSSQKLQWLCCACVSIFSFSSSIIINVFDSLSNAILANWFLLISSTLLVECKGLTLLQKFQVSSYFKNNTPVSLKIKKDIFGIIFILVLAKKKVFWKNRALLNLFFIRKLAKIISNVLRIKLFIFWALALVKQTLKPIFNANAGFITWNLVKLIKASTLMVFFWKQRKY